MTHLREVEDPGMCRISAEDCDLSDENRNRLADLIEKYVPGVSRVTLHLHSTNHFTLSIEFSPEVSDTFAALNEALKKLQHFVPGKSTKFHIV